MTQPAPTTDPTRAGGAPRADDELAFAAQAMLAEADAIRHAADRVDAAFSKAVDLMIGAVEAGASVVVSGMGKSGLIGQKISATMASVGVASHVVHPAEAVHGDLGRIRSGDCALLLSYSGETDEVVALASILRQDGVPVISITKGAGTSALERLSTVPLSIGVVEEACSMTLAPTSSTTATLALGDALALAASRRLAFTADDFRKRHPGGWLGELLRPVRDILRFVAGENLPIIPARGTVLDALETAATGSRRPGALVLVDDDGVLVGLFTDGDLRRLVLQGPDQLRRPVTEVMTRSPRTLPDTAQVQDALRLIREYRSDEIPVVDSAGRPVGVLDVQDVLALKVARD
jgi:arabinose-5-phosphate isomerase